MASSEERRPTKLQRRPHEAPSAAPAIGGIYYQDYLVAQGMHDLGAAAAKRTTSSRNAPPAKTALNQVGRAGYHMPPSLDLQVVSANSQVMLPPDSHGD